jgi:TolA-binding protein
MSHASPQIPLSPPTAGMGKKKWMPWVIAAAAFVLGVGVGNTGAKDPESSEPYLAVQADLRSEQERTTQLTDEVEEARADIQRAADEAEARLAGQVAQLEQRGLELDQRASEVAAQEQALRAEQQAAPAPAPAPAPARIPAPVPAPRAPASSSVYYDNCTAARNAGAAPVRVGDPGYASHLDRDGDGIGCE